MSERIGDRDIAFAVTAPLGTVVPDASRWTVVVDSHGQPATAIAPGGVSITEDLVVADAEVPVAAALGSKALSYAAASTVVVVTKGTSVVGIWSGSDLLGALLRRVTRAATASLPGDLQLPGRITKKNITRRCRYTTHGVSCATILVVPEKPESMPQCPAQGGITLHAFVW